MTITAIDKPEGYDGAYKFFENDATGNKWKVKLEMRQAREALVEATVALAPGEYAVVVTVSPVDAEGKALLESGKPIVIDSHTHTFNNVEMSAPDFSAEARIMLIVNERILAGEARLTGVNSVDNLVKGWS